MWIFHFILSTILILLMISYFIDVLFSRIMFDILGVNKSLAWIPLYNYYRIFKEYKGRVWKRNWGALYIFITVLPYFFIAVLATFKDLALIFFEPLDKYMIHREVTSLLLVYAIIVVIINAVQKFLDIIFYWPILHSKIQTTIFILSIIFSSSILSQIFKDDSLIVDYYSMLGIVFGIAFFITYFVAAISLRGKIKNKTMILNSEISDNRKLAKEV